MGRPRSRTTVRTAVLVFAERRCHDCGRRIGRREGRSIAVAFDKVGCRVMTVVPEPLELPFPEVWCELRWTCPPCRRQIRASLILLQQNPFHVIRYPSALSPLKTRQLFRVGLLFQHGSNAVERIYPNSPS